MKGDNDKLILGLAFLALTFLNVLGFIKLTDQYIFAISIATIFFSVATFFERYFKAIFCILGILSMVCIPVITSSDLLIEVMKKFNSNSIALLSMGIAFISIYISNYMNHIGRLEKEEQIKDKEAEIYKKINDIINKR